MSDKPELRLFVWTNWNPDYTGGLAVAIAKDETQARKMIVTKCGYEPHNWGTLSVHKLTYAQAYCVSGGG